MIVKFFSQFQLRFSSLFILLIMHFFRDIFDYFRLFQKNWRLAARVQKNLQTDSPQIQVQNEQYMWLLSSLIWDNIKRGGVYQRQNAGFFQILCHFLKHFTGVVLFCFCNFFDFGVNFLNIFRSIFRKFSIFEARLGRILTFLEEKNQKFLDIAEKWFFENRDFFNGFY